MVAGRQERAYVSLRRISARLAAAGYLNELGREFNPNSIKSMVER
jgi:hypothetical protein